MLYLLRLSKNIWLITVSFILFPGTKNSWFLVHTSLLSYRNFDNLKQLWKSLLYVDLTSDNFNKMNPLCLNAAVADNSHCHQMTMLSHLTSARKCLILYRKTTMRNLRWKEYRLCWKTTLPLFGFAFFLCARAFLFSRILPSRLGIKSFLVCVLLQMYDLASLAEPLVFSLVSRAIVAD